MNDIIILLCWETDTSNSIGKEQTVDVEKTHLSLCVCVCNICNEWGLYKRYKLQNDKKLLQVRLSDLETSSTTLWCVLSVQFLDCTISWVYCYLSVHVLCWICAVYSVLVSGSKQFTVNLSIIYTIFACWKVLLRFCQTLCYVQYLHQFCEHFFLYHLSDNQILLVLQSCGFFQGEMRLSGYGYCFVYVQTEMAVLYGWLTFFCVQFQSNFCLPFQNFK